MKKQSYPIKQDEDLLSNLRKSKLFLDDSDVGLYSKEVSLQSIQEDNNSQAFQNAEKIVGLMHSSKKKCSKVQSQQNKNPEFLELVQKAQQEISSKRESKNSHNRVLFEVNDLQTYNRNGLPNNLFAQQQSIFNIKKDSKQNNNSPIIEFNGSQNNNQQNQQTINGKSSTNFIRSSIQNNLNQPQVQVNDNHSKIFENISNGSNSENLFKQNDSNQINSHQQQQSNQRSSSYNIRIRGSSSKKKNILFESPFSSKKIRECSDEKYPTLDQQREIIHAASCQLQVNEDVEGENEGQAQPILDESICNKKRFQEGNDDKMHILNLNDFSSLRNKPQVNSSQKLNECLSNKAEPATNVKQNPLLFEQSASNKKFFNLDEVCSKASNPSSSSSHTNQFNNNTTNYDYNITNIQQSIQTQSDFQNSLSNFQEPNQVTITQSIQLKGDSNNIPKESTDNQNIINYFINQNLNNDNRKFSFQNFKQNISSPKKFSFNPSNEIYQLNMKAGQTDKSVDQHQLQNSNFSIMNKTQAQENSNGNEENLIDGESPKMRQKSVKFENNLFTPYQNQQLDEEHRLNQKLQSRKPTPYNYEKHISKSQHARQNKFTYDDIAISQDLQLNSSSCSKKSNQSDNLLEKISNPSQKEQVESNEIDKKTPPIFKSMESKNTNFFQKQKTVSSHLQNTSSLQTSSHHQSQNINNKNQKNIVNKPQVQKRKDEISQIQSNNFFKNENTNSTPLLINSKQTSGPKNNGFDKPLQNLKKRKPLNEEQAILSNFISSQRIKSSEESSLPLPSQMRGTMLSVQAPLQYKSVFKTCIYCQIEIKPKEDVKSFICCHKAHKKCLPKDKNPKCLRCNSTN